MVEDPDISGNSDNSISQFGLFVDQALKINLKARYQLDFEMYNTDFPGGSSSSQKIISASGGIYYLF